MFLAGSSILKFGRIGHSIILGNLFFGTSKFKLSDHGENEILLSKECGANLTS